MSDGPTIGLTEEIEVTPEMIEVGAEIIDRWAKEVQEGWVSALEVAPLVWSAMISQMGRALESNGLPLGCPVCGAPQQASMAFALQQGVHTGYQPHAVSEEYPVAVRSVDGGGYELALLLSQIPSLPPGLRAECGNDRRLFVSRVAAVVADKGGSGE